MIKEELLEKKGRAFVSTRAIKKGEIVLRIAPVAAALKESELKKYCSGCFTSIPHVLKSCSKCKCFSYCPSCIKRELFIHQESKECEFLQKNQNRPKLKDESHFLRCLLRICLLSQNPPQLDELRRSSKPSKTEAFETVFDTWEDVLKLQSNFHEVFANTDVPNSFANQIQNKAQEAHELCPQLKSNMDIETLTKMIRALYLNGHEIIFPFKNLGMGLYPAGAIFNHSCLPNLAFFHDSQGMSCFRCIRDVPSAGIELCSSYIDTYQPTEVRREHLFGRYSFYCECERCRLPLEQSDDKYLRGYLCKNKNCGNLLSKDQKDQDILICSKCSGTTTVDVYRKIEEKVQKFHAVAQQEAAQENYQKALPLVLEALTLANSHFHKHHYLNFLSYYYVSVVTSEVGNFQVAVQYTMKQLDCLGIFKEGSMIVKQAQKYRDLATYLQDWAKEEANQGGDPNSLIDQSYHAFLEAHKRYTFLYGEKHWYTETLHKVVLMMDGKCDPQELVEY